MSSPHYDALVDYETGKIVPENVPLVIIIWGLGFCNQFLALIILLNFLIAIIS